MEPRFRALRTIGSIFRILGYIALVLTILAALAFCGFSVIGASAIESSIAQQLGVSSTGAGFVSGLFGGLIGGILVLIYGGIVSMWIIAIGELFYLLIGVEENTRKTNFLIESQMAKMAPASSSTMTPSEPPMMTPSQPTIPPTG